MNDSKLSEIQEQSNEVLKYQQSLSKSQQESASLKLINAKLLAQLQVARQQISVNSEPETFTTDQQQQPQSNKKKKKKNNQIDNHSPQETNIKSIETPVVFDETVQDLLISLQTENKRLSSDILGLKEEISKLTNEKEILTTESTFLRRQLEELTEKVESLTAEKTQNDHKIESLILESQKWQQEAKEINVLLQNARQQCTTLNEDCLKLNQTIESSIVELKQNKETIETLQNDLEEKNRKVPLLNEEITLLLDKQTSESLSHIEEIDRRSKIMEKMLNEVNDERNGFIQKISFLESTIQNNQTFSRQQSEQIEELKNQLKAMTEERNELEREKNEYIERYNSYQEMTFERESTTTKQWNERINKLELSLAETEESLLVAQSTLKTYEIQEVKSEYERKKLTEENTVLTRMREKAEMKVDIEIQKSQLSEKLRKEAMEESQRSAEQYRQCADELDVVQKQLRDLKKEFRVKFDLVEGLQNTKFEQETKIESLNDQITGLLKYVDIAAEVDPLRQQIEELKQQIVILDEVKAEKNQLQINYEQQTNEMLTLSEAFELRGRVIRDLEKQSELIQSDISFLKLDDSMKRNQLNALRETIAQNNSVIEKHEAELLELRNLVSDYKSKYEILKTADEKLKQLQKSYKDSMIAYDALDKRHQETNSTLEELSQTAAEEIENKNLEIQSLTEQLTNKNQITAEYEKLSNAYEKLVHQYSDLMDERSELFQKYSETRIEIEKMKTNLME